MTTPAVDNYATGMQSYAVICPAGNYFFSKQDETIKLAGESLLSSVKISSYF